MEAVAYSTFRNNLKSYMRKTYDDAEQLLITNNDIRDNIVVMNMRDYDNLIETVRIYSNPYLYDKIKRGMLQEELGSTSVHDLIEENHEVQNDKTLDR